jgi:hypothetical protein
MRRTDFRTILEPFYRRYPQGNYLFLFTSDWNEIAFVSPQRVAIEPGKTKLRLRILLIDRKTIYHTDLEVLKNIAILPAEQRADIIWQKHLEAFDVERVTKEFFEAYKFALEFIKGELMLQKKASYQMVHSFAQQLLSRIMFLYFVQKKGWLKQRDYIQDKRYINSLWIKYKKNKKKPDTFYSLWLSSLFFQAFNKKHLYLKFDLPSEIKESFSFMPFLNGGLFTENELDKIGFEIPDRVFELLFETDPLDKKKGFLERYNFTVREDTPLEVEVAVDPEMLGKVYESLISEEERGKVGIFYTPRIEIDYMCRISLVEYLYDVTKIPKEDIIQFVFEPSDSVKLSSEYLKKIEGTLERVQVVDPAVGSASFLVGMMNVLAELHRSIAYRFNQVVNEFDLKNRIISQNLYGVDVKDWAVMVGELRLWLSLIIETEEKEITDRLSSIYDHPLLPNLTFKMRQGDSLVEDIAGVHLSLRSRLKYIPAMVKKRITEIIDKKDDYFRSARLDKKKEIEKLESDLLRDIVGNEINRFNKEIEKLEREIYYPPKQLEFIKVPEQAELFRKETQKTKEKIKELREEQERYQRIIEGIGKKGEKDYFLWEIDFAEIFSEKGGFDIVIGNPPYVRQEKIGPPLEREEDFDLETWRKKKRKYKEELSQSIQAHWGNFVKISKKSDLYVYFYYHGLALLRPNGIFCFINSNAWLDVGYGTSLQEFLLKNMEPLHIVDNQAKRSFKESDINTIMVAIKRPEEIKDNATVKFINYKKSFEEALTPDNLLEIERSSKIKSTDDFRVYPITRKKLLKDGVDLSKEKTLLRRPENLPYIGSKWGGKYLRAPDIFFKILERNKDKIVKLGNIAQIKYGIKTGLNDFFYLTEKKITKWKIEEQFLKPMLFSIKETKCIHVNEKDFEYKLFYCDKSKSQLKREGFENSLRYIEYAEKNLRAEHESSIFDIPSLKGKDLWYALKKQMPPDFVVNQFIGDRFIFLEGGNFFVCNVFFVGYLGRINRKLTLAVLNSTPTFLITEVLGRKTYGIGVMYIYGPEIKNQLLLNPELLEKKGLEKEVLSVYSKLSMRPLRSIFEECGFNREIRIRDQEPTPLPDRSEIDTIIFDILDLNQYERKEVYWSLCELVQLRLQKAKSLEENKLGGRYVY